MLNTMVEEDKVSRDLKPSPELLSLIKAAVSSLIAFGELWESIKHKGIDEGFREQDLQDMLRPLLRDKLGMSKDKIYYLFHKEEQKERVKTSQDNRKKTKFLDKKEPEQKDEEIKLVGSEELNQLAETIKKLPRPTIDPEEPNEDPQALEIQFLKEQNAELQEALKKTEQFRPATQLQEKRDEYGTDENKVFDWLGKREDKVSRYWFPNYGVELFRTRILSDLNNRGVKMFKRLYFEV